MENTAMPPVNGGKMDDTFRRVWQRVMPDQANSPIVLEEKPEPEVPESAVPGDPTPEPEPSPEPEPDLPQVPPCSEEEDTSHSQCPCTGEPELCLGEGSQGDTLRLEELMNLARSGMLAGQMLFRRTGGRCARTMCTLTNDHRLALRRLSAAYFLITGKRFKPCCPAKELPSSVSLALREQFMWEQRWEHCNNQAAQATQDPCLKALYEELSQEGALHAGTIRSLLEQMT